MAAIAEMRITLDPETKAAIEALTDQVKALRDLLDTKAGVEYHYHFQGDANLAEALKTMQKADLRATQKAGRVAY